MVHHEQANVCLLKGSVRIALNRKKKLSDVFPYFGYPRDVEAVEDDLLALNFEDTGSPEFKVLGLNAGAAFNY